MTDYTKQCWLCGSTKLIQIGDFFACNICRTTYNDLPKLDSPIMEKARDNGKLAPDIPRRTSQSPSKTAVRRATTARKGKEGGK